MRRSVAWSCSVVSLLALGSSCGDDGSTSQPAAGGDDAAAGTGADAAGASSGASGGQAPGGGSTSMPGAGEANAGVPASQAGAPSTGAGGAAAGAGGAADGAGGAADEGVIAVGQDSPSGIAVDATNVYWASSGKILSCPLAGCGAGAPTVVIDNAGEARGIAVDAASVYWMSAPNVSNTASIKKCPLTGCLAQPVILGDVSSMRPNDVHVVGTQLIYTAWPNFSLCTTSDCSPQARTPLGGGMPVVAVDTDASYIYFSRYGNAIISRCDRSDCANLIDLATGQVALSVAVDATTLYFSKLGALGFQANPQPRHLQMPARRLCQRRSRASPGRRLGLRHRARGCFTLTSTATGSSAFPSS